MPVKQPPVLISPTQAVATVVSNAVPSTGSAPIKAVDQPKEAPPAQSKNVPKPSVEEKKLAVVPDSPAPETTNKPVPTPILVSAPVVAPQATPSAKSVVATPSQLKGTMRLATVTPARQKKPPATNNKKSPPIPTPSVQNAPKSPVKGTSAPAKPAEVQKPPTPAKKSTSTPAPATSKTSSAPSTSSAQSGSVTPKTKRSRVPVQPYQSPTPEIVFVTKLSAQTANPSAKNGTDDKLTIFYK